LQAKLLVLYQQFNYQPMLYGFGKVTWSSKSIRLATGHQTVRVNGVDVKSKLATSIACS